MKTFTAIDADGTVLYSARGKVGAAQKALNALREYRDAVWAGSGMLHGNPSGMGRIEVNGVRFPAEDFGGYLDAELVAEA